MDCGLPTMRHPDVNFESCVESWINLDRKWVSEQKWVWAPVYKERVKHRFFHEVEMATAVPSFISRVSQRNRYYPSSVHFLKLQQQNRSFIILITLGETLKLSLTFHYINQSLCYIASKLLLISMNLSLLPWYAFLLLYFSLFFMLGMK